MPEPEPDPTPGNEDDPVALLDADGKFSEDFFDNIPEEHTELIAKADKLKGIPDVYSALNKMIHAEHMIGANKVEMPTEHSTDEVKAAYREAIGVPKEVTGYEGITRPTDWPEAVPWDDKLIEGYSAIAHELEIPKSKAKGLFDWYCATKLQEETAFKEFAEQEQATAMESLRTKPGWGEDTEKNLEKIKHLQKFLSRGIEKDVILDLEADGLGNKAGYLQMMMNMVKIVSEKRIEGASPESVEATATLTEQLQQVLDDPYYLSSNPKDKPANRTLHNQLVQKAMTIRERIKAIKKAAS